MDTALIKPINTDTVHKICSGQVVLSLAVAVKELVENSLDAGATSIEVRLKNYGIDMIEVSDNGSGVAKDNFSALTQKYHTSKLNEYSDLLGVKSFGFRGEALSSLCLLANVIITTRHKDADYATKIEYDDKGNITKESPCSRQVGTTVTLTKLFHSLPVRQKEFHKNVKREFHKMTNLLYAYCLISLGVKITCTNQTTSNAKTIVVATNASQQYKDNIASVFGVKQLQTLMEIKTESFTNIKDNIFKGLSGTINEIDENVVIPDIEIDLSEDSNDAAENIEFNGSSENESVKNSQKSQGYKNVQSPVQLTGFISSCAHGSGRSSTDRQYYYVNSRPCEPTKVIKTINEIYKQFNSHQYPFVLLNITLDRDMVDVNVTPDKRKIFLTKEKHILDVIKHSLLKMYESVPKTLKIEPINNANINANIVKADIDQPRIHNSFLRHLDKSNSSYDQSAQNNNVKKDLDLKRKSSNLLDSFGFSKNKKKENCYENVIEKINMENSFIKKDKSSNVHEVMDLKEGFSTLEVKKEDRATDNHENNPESSNKSTSDRHIKSSDNLMYLEYTSQLPDTQIKDLSEFMAEQSHTIYCKTKSIVSKSKITHKNESAKKVQVITDKEDLGKYHRKTVTLKTSLEHIKELTNIYNTKNTQTFDLDRVKFKSVINPVFNKKCEEELTREISKDSFKRMNVIGQFNLGFIIAQLDDDLFIIDQHATDEIYNFETLQKTTELTSQKLVISQQLELTSVNEQILIDNLEVFKKNGFTFEINDDAPPTKKVKLLTLPMSKNWIFGKDDIDELLFMLRENPTEHCRPSRIRAMFASRACRKSVMIGTALGNADMKKLVDHMGEIDKPWNCPHGRPTIRHLVNLAMVHKTDLENFENETLK